MSKATFTFRLDEDLKSEFTSAAKVCGRTGAQLLRDFMREFVQRQQEVARRDERERQQVVKHDAWFRREVQVGLDSAEAGRLVPGAEVNAKFAARRAATRRRLEASE